MPRASSRAPRSSAAPLLARGNDDIKGTLRLSRQNVRILHSTTGHSILFVPGVLGIDRRLHAGQLPRRVKTQRSPTGVTSVVTRTIRTTAENKLGGRSGCPSSVNLVPMPA